MVIFAIPSVDFHNECPQNLRSSRAIQPVRKHCFIRINHIVSFSQKRKICADLRLRQRDFPGARYVRREEYMAVGSQFRRQSAEFAVTFTHK